MTRRNSRFAPLWVLVLLLGGCGSVSSTDADGGNGGGGDGGSGGEDGGAADAPGPDACVNRLDVSVQFRINEIVGQGDSSLEQLLNRTNGILLHFEDWNILTTAHADPGTGTTIFKTSVKADADDFEVEFTGQDRTFLNDEVGQHITRGLAVDQSLFELGHNGHFHLYMLPENTQLHPYMQLDCRGIQVIQDGGGFPVLDTLMETECTFFFYDFRDGNSMHIRSADNTTLELTNVDCSAP